MVKMYWSRERITHSELVYFTSRGQKDYIRDKKFTCKMSTDLMISCDGDETKISTSFTEML